MPPRDASRLLTEARIIYTAIARIAGIEGPPPPGCRPTSPSRVILSLYASRRGALRASEAAWTAACTLAAAGHGRVDPSKAGLALARRRDPPGLYTLVDAVRGYVSQPSREKLVEAVEALASELASPCSPDPRLEEERRRMEERMKMYGGLLGLLLAVIFAAGLYASVTAGLLALGSLVAVWAGISLEGRRFHRLNVESAWRRCTLDPDAIEEAVSGPSLPSPFDLLGLPRPEL